MSLTIQNNWQAHSSNHTVKFGLDIITTTVTNDPQVVVHWISLTERRLQTFNLQVIGLEVELKLPDNPVAVVQLCVAERCLVYQILNSPYVPAELFRFFDNPNYTFTGVDVKSNLGKLQGWFGGLGSMAVYMGLMRRGPKEYVVGSLTDKPRQTTTSVWDVEFLTQDQIMYACFDAYLSYKNGRALVLETCSSKYGSIRHVL